MTLATRITLFRLCLVPVFCYCIYQYTGDAAWFRYAAVTIYVIAAVSDLVDGYIARNWNQQTALGTRLDPTADKLMINLGFIFMAANPEMEPHLPKWFPVAILARDMILVLGAHLIYKVYTRVEIAPRVTGKVNTFFQIVCMVSFLTAAPFAPWVMWATFGAGVVSLVDYITVGVTQARDRAAGATA